MRSSSIGIPGDSQFNVNSILPGYNTYRDGDFNYRGRNFFNRNPDVRRPQNYKRSDEKIYKDINDVLTDDPDIDASEIEIEVQDGVVKLSGMVNDRSQKRKTEILLKIFEDNKY